ncbi:MAG TPA: hypothetical protein VGE91_11005 [Solirubrobacterales bacterium]|jgi:hypothetical protein
MPDSEHLTVKAVEPAGAQPAIAPLAVDAGLLELLKRDHAVLPGGDAGDDGVRTAIGDLCMHGNA